MLKPIPPQNSWKIALVSVVIGILGVIINLLKQDGYLEQFTTTQVNLVTLVCVFLLVYGLITLGNYDWKLGKNRDK